MEEKRNEERKKKEEEEVGRRVSRARSGDLGFYVWSFSRLVGRHTARLGDIDS